MATNSAVVGLLRAILTLDTAEFAAGGKRAQDELKAFSTNFQKIGREATQLGTALTKTLTLPILAIAGASAKAAIDFESSFAGVRKTVNATEDEFAAMAQAFRNLAKEIPVNVNELNRLGEAAGALGIPKAEIVDFARVMAMLGVTTNVTADQAAESIAKIQNIFNAAGQDTDRFAATLVALGNDGASTESQILEMATRIAGAGNTIGMTQGQVLAFASALSSVGIEAEMGGSAISRVFIDIASAVNKGGEDLANFAKVSGQSAAEFSKLFKDDAAKAVESFIQGLSKIKESGGNLLGTLEQLGFQEIRVRDTLLRTAGAGDLLTRALNLQSDAWDKNTALTEEARKRFETTEAKIQLLWNRVKDLAITFGNALKPAIETTINLVNGLIPFVDKLAHLFAGLPGPVQLAAGGLLAVVAAAGPAIYIFGQLAIASSALAKAFTAQGIAATVAGTAMGPLAAGIAAVGRALAFAVPYLAAFTAGAAIAAIHTERLEAMKTSAMDLAKANDLIRAKQEELNRAIANGNDKQEFKLRAELKALEAGKAAGEQAERATKQQEDAAKVAAFASFNYDLLKTSATGAGNALDGAGDSADALTKKLKSLKDAQADAIIEAKAWAQFMGANPMKQPIALQQQYVDVLKRVIEQFGSLEKAGIKTTAWMGTWMALAPQTTSWLDQFKPRVSEIVDLAGEWEHEQQKVADATNATRASLELLAKVSTTLPKGLLGVKLPDVQTRLGATFTQGFSEAFKNLGPTIMAALTGGGNILQSVGSLFGGSLGSSVVANFGKSIIGTLGKTIGGAFNALIPGLGAMLGPLLGKIGDFFGNLFGKGKGRQMVEDFASTFGGFDQLHEKLGTLGDAGEQLWIKLTQGVKKGDTKAAQAAIEAITKALGDQERVLSKYGLTLDDLKTPQQKFTDAIKTLLGDLKSLQGMGFSDKTIVGGMKDQLNDLLRTALETGQKLPAAFGPLAIELVKSGGLATDLKNKLLGIADPVPWKEMQAIAEEFEIDLAALGPAFQQAKLGETAQEFAGKFMLLVDNGADVGAVIEGMGKKANEFLLNAKKWGLELPASMRPLFEKMIEAGELVDENGEKILDLKDIKFGKTLAEEFDPLIEAIKELIDLFANKAPKSVEDFKRSFGGGIRVPVVYEPSGPGPGASASYAPPSFTGGSPQSVFAGGVAPAMVVAGAAARSRDLVIQMNGRDWYRLTLSDMVDAMEQYGVGVR